MPPTAHPVDPSFMRVRPGRCLRCGEALGARPHWITNHPDGEHEDCRRDGRRTFPFDGELDRLRRVARHLARTQRTVVTFGRWLAAARRRWPAGASHTAREVQRRRQRVERELAELVDRLRR